MKQNFLDIHRTPTKLETAAGFWCNANHFSRALALYVQYLVYRRNQKTGRCCPSQETIVKDTGISRASINRFNHKLKQLGYIVIKHEKNSRGIDFDVFDLSKLLSFFCNANMSQKAARKKTKHTSVTKNTNVNNVVVGVTNKVTNGNTKLVTRPQRKNTFNGIFGWMRKVPHRCEDPLQEFFNRTDSGYYIAYYPPYAGMPEEYETQTEVKPEIQSIILSRPIDCAISMTGEKDNPIFLKTLLARKKQLGHKRFAAEVLNFFSILELENTPEKKAYFADHPEKKIRNRGKVLVSRLNRCVSWGVASDGFTKPPEWGKVWDVIDGKREMPIFVYAA